ncbi:MAG: hypothetical protein QOC96_1245 [Acidobacteriota bacterium]|jgi:hypothetical protein|nr:hypothetical protein [Acidobacteriota bacterium]
MSVNRIILTLILLTTGALNNVLALGIIQRQGEIVARKFDEFDLTEIYYDDMKARLDSFITDALMSNPNSRAYLILYRSRSNYSRFRPWQLRDYLVNARGIPASRVKAVYGGYRKVPTLELWVVPDGALDPKATPTITIKKRRKPEMKY